MLDPWHEPSSAHLAFDIGMDWLVVWRRRLREDPPEFLAVSLGPEAGCTRDGRHVLARLHRLGIRVCLITCDTSPLMDESDMNSLMCLDGLELKTLYRRKWLQHVPRVGASLLAVPAPGQFYYSSRHKPLPINIVLPAGHPGRGTGAHGYPAARSGEGDDGRDSWRR